MIIAIHDRPGSFSDYWIEYCYNNSIEYKIVNAFDNNIIQQVKDCDAFMWHHHHGQFKDVLTAKRILFALEQAGLKVFPNFNTGWHFDDKVAQKYLLEAIDAPLVPSYVFYDKEKAIAWVQETNYPKVFKLKGGASAQNVKLVNNKREALKLVKKAFNTGFSQFDRVYNLKNTISNYQLSSTHTLRVIKDITRLFVIPEFARVHPKEKNYIYFQDFIPNNSFDVRVVVIGNQKAFAEKRFVRKNDFRASGSGLYSYEDIDIQFIEEAFKLSKRLNLQSVAFDFILSSYGKPLVVELSYGFGTLGINSAPGYWDQELKWHKAKTKLPELIIEHLLKLQDTL